MKKQYLSIHEVFGILSARKEPNAIEGDSLSYVERVKIGSQDGKKSKKELVQQFGLDERVAVKLVDLSPASKEEITSILSNYSVIKDDKELTQILDYLVSNTS